MRVSQIGQAWRNLRHWWRNLDRRDKFELSLQVVIAFLTLGFLIVTWWQLREIRASVKVATDQAKAAEDANRIAQETLRITQRPWAGIELVALDKPLTFDSTGATLIGRVRIKNFGNSPATNTVLLITSIFGENATEVERRHKLMCSDSHTPFDKLSIGFSLLPNQTTNMPNRTNRAS
jgi:hypothetical protein